MRTLQKALAGACLVLGLSITALATVELVDSDEDWEDRAEAGAALVIFGLAPIALGAWLAWHLRSSEERPSQMLTLQQEQVFVQLLQSNGGDLSIVQFAAAAQIPVEQAKAFLDQKAKVLNASFDVKETGAIVYRFPL
jgi:hypothetical protein